MPLQQSVLARECGMIPYHHAVFLGDLVVNGNSKKIVWTQIEQVEDADDDNVKVEEEDKENKAEEVKNQVVDPEMEKSNFAEYIPRQISDSLEIQLEKTLRSVHRSKLSVSPGKKKTILSDDENEPEKVYKYPWEESGLPYSLAFTGKAFDYLMKHDPL